MSWLGQLTHIHIAEQGAAPMQPLGSAKLIAGVGIEGDRYATGRGYYSKTPRADRQVTLIEMETLEALARDHGIELLPSETRRNLTTRDVPLNHLVGRRFRVGAVRWDVGHHERTERSYYFKLPSASIFDPKFPHSGPRVFQHNRPLADVWRALSPTRRAAATGRDRASRR